MDHPISETQRTPSQVDGVLLCAKDRLRNSRMIALYAREVVGHAADSSSQFGPDLQLAFTRKSPTGAADFALSDCSRGPNTAKCVEIHRIPAGRFHDAAFEFKST
jgi:hypothetical protein